MQIPKQAPQPPTGRELVRMLQREICELRAQLASPNRQHRDSPAVSPETESAAPKHWRQAMIESIGDCMPLSLETAAEEDFFLELHTPV